MNLSLFGIARIANDQSVGQLLDLQAGTPQQLRHRLLCLIHQTAQLNCGRLVRCGTHFYAHSSDLVRCETAPPDNLPVVDGRLPGKPPQIRRCPVNRGDQLYLGDAATGGPARRYERLG
jgi:hypothetical protein